MPRRLPWQTNTADATGSRSSPARSTTTRSTPARRIPKPILDSSDIEADAAYTPRPCNPSNPTSCVSRRPTTTPIRENPTPRSRAHSVGGELQPSPEEYMISGWGDDDPYRMVEDEFLDVAKEFTHHLHAAEYLRLKAAARSKSSSTTNIARPVSGASIPDAARRKLDGIERAKKQADAVAKVKEAKNKDKWERERDAMSAEEAPEPWVGTALHGLMEERSQKVPTIMDAVFKEAMKYDGGQDEIDTESEEDDDLDAPVVKQEMKAEKSWTANVVVPSSPPRPIRAKYRQPAPSPLRSTPPPQPQAVPRKGMMFRSRVPQAIKEPPSSAVSSAASVELPRTSADVLARLARRREAAKLKGVRVEEKKKEEKKKRKSEDGDRGVIPTFL